MTNWLFKVTRPISFIMSLMVQTPVSTVLWQQAVAPPPVNIHNASRLSGSSVDSYKSIDTHTRTQVRQQQQQFTATDGAGVLMAIQNTFGPILPTYLLTLEVVPFFPFFSIFHWCGIAFLSSCFHYQNRMQSISKSVDCLWALLLSQVSSVKIVLLRILFYCN